MTDFISALSPGDQVLIVPEWMGDKHSYAGEMDKYLNTVLTVKRIEIDSCDSDGSFFKAIEDHGEWYWYNEMIAEIISPDSELDDQDIATYDDVTMFIMT